MECSWSKVTGSNQVFQGQWSSSLTYNGTPNGLSIGAKAGIGVGAGIGGVATIAAVIAFCYKRHIKAAVREVPPEMDGQAMQAPGQTRADKSAEPSPYRVVDKVRAVCASWRMLATAPTAVVGSLSSNPHVSSHIGA
jgi:hypothetical protein